jgi:hypothetical protein
MSTTGVAGVQFMVRVLPEDETKMVRGMISKAWEWI